MHQDLPKLFSDAQLTRVLGEATIYMCACPAQVAVQILKLRELFSYQQQCLVQEGLSAEVHRAIAQSTQRAHDELERCLDTILTLEGWDRETLSMPAGLRKIRDEKIERA